MSKLLEIKDLEIRYKQKIILNNINLSIQQGEILGIVGESGSGKSTLLKTIMGLTNKNLIMTKGHIFYNDKDLYAKSSYPSGIRGNKISIIFQDTKLSLCPVRTIGEQLYEMVLQHQKTSKEKVFATASILFQKINLNDTKKILNSYPFELSGGMCQKVGIIFAMILKPSILLADEPTSALDVTVQKQVLDEMRFLCQTFNTSIILVSHNINVIKYMADNIIVMQNGKIVEYNTTYQIFNNPQKNYTKQLLGCVLHLNKG